MFDMAMDIVNLSKEKRIPSELMRIFAKNRFIQTERGNQLGFETTFFEDNNMVFLEANHPLYIEFSNRPDWDGFGLIAPEIQDYEERLAEIVGTVADKIKIWLDSPIKNKGIDVNLAQNFLSKMPIEITFNPDFKDGWQPKLGFKYKSRDLSDHIITSDFLIPLAQDRGIDFNRIRQCPECNKYFYALDMRKNFCSSICRSRMFNRTKKEEQTA